MIDSQNLKFAKAKGGYVDQVPCEMLVDPLHVLERKYDGCRYRMIIGQNNIILQSRRVSKKTGKFVEKQDRVPHLTEIPFVDRLHYDGTVLEGEVVVSPDACTSSEVVSIMGCDAEKAIARQMENGMLHWVLFDVLFIEGIDVRDLPESVRREKLGDILRDLQSSGLAADMYWHLSERRFLGTDRSHMDTYEEFIEAGYEGGMLKDTTAVYGKGWWKMKPVVEIDVVCTGFTEGKGKFEGQIGAVEFGVVQDTGVVVYLGKASGMDDPTRRFMTDNQATLVGVPLEVACQEVCRKKDWYSLRHPRFKRWRDDINRSDCTAEKLEREIK